MKVKARFEIVPVGFFALAVSTMSTTAWATDPIVGVLSMPLIRYGNRSCHCRYRAQTLQTIWFGEH
jgi:hypothetical protein